MATNKLNNLPADLSWKTAFLFPIQDQAGRKDILIGGLLILFLWPIGWILNLGNRLNMVARLAKGEAPIFIGFKPWLPTFFRGFVAAKAISLYLFPSILLLLGSFLIRQNQGSILLQYTLLLLSACAFILAIFTLPGCMTVFAVAGDTAILKQPVKAFRRTWVHRKLYFKAWRIALTSILLSLLGLIGLGIGFLFTSVWAWEVTGYVFTVALYGDDKEQEIINGSLKTSGRADGKNGQTRNPKNIIG